MADPFTLAMGATVAGGGISTIGKLMGGEAQSDMYKYQAGVAKVNQDIAKQNAAYARYGGEFEAQRYGMKTRYETGQAKVIQSGRGVDIASGSAQGVRDSMGDISRHDQATIRATAARRAYGHEVEGMREGQKAEMARISAENAKTASYLDAASSVLGTASSVSGKWMQAKQVGLYSDYNPTAMSSTSWEGY